VSQTQQLKIYQVCGKSHKGLVRAENQDAFDYFESVNGAVFVLCDGMGGIPGGKKAAKQTIKHIKKFISEDWFDDEKKLISEAIDFANNQIREKLAQPEINVFPGTTLTIVLIRDNKVFFAHAGDSRIYYQTGKKLFKLTEDHSLVMKLLKEKKITAKEAEDYPQKNIIYNAVGINEQVKPGINQKPIFPADDDLILMCSDGLHNEITDEEILKILTEEKDIKKKANTLLKKALKAGGNDNITVQLIQFYNTGNKSGKNYIPKSEKKKKNLKLIAILAFLFLIINALFLFNYFFDIKNPTISRQNTTDISVTDELTYKINTTDNKFYKIGRNIYSYPGINKRTIIDILKINNKNEFYFYPGETIHYKSAN